MRVFLAARGAPHPAQAKHTGVSKSQVCAAARMKNIHGEAAAPKKNGALSERAPSSMTQETKLKLAER